MSFPLRSRVALVLSLLVLGGCGGGHHAMQDDPDSGSPVVSAFLLEDVNSNSASFTADVSPRQHLSSVSAWYFGHAT